MELGSDLTKLLNILEFTHRLSEDGQTTVLLNLKELLVINEFITSILKVMNYSPTQTKLRISMLESVLQNKKTILKDNLNFYKINSLLIQLLKILALDLTLNDADYSNSWNCLIKDSFKQLWLPAKTDSVDSDLIFSNGNLNKVMLNSWFLTQSTSHPKTNLQKTFLPFYKSLLVDGMEKENILLRTKKIRLQLTSIQIKQLETWRHSCRYSYNKCIWLIKEDPTLSKLDLRNLITPEITNTRTPWILETPKSIREASVFEAVKNRKACLINLKNKNINHFELRFLSRKKESWTIGGFEDVKKKSAKALSVFPTYNMGYFKTKEIIPDNFKTCSIHFDGLYYYILMPVETNQKSFNDRNPCVSSDPGVRTFNTFYDGYEEKCYKVGERASDIIYKDLIGLDKLISLKTSKNINNKSRKLINKHISKKRIRIQNLQSELHWKVSNWVCKKFDRVIIPKFESQKMCKKEFRKISTKTVRNMSVLSHGKFLERLKTKAEEFRSEIVIVKEDYTTMTCGKCYNRNLKIGSLEEWVCPKCKHYHDRDCNASRNILQKQL